MKDLTPYDTGEVAEPVVWKTRGDRSRYGHVDFTNDESATVCTVRVPWSEELGRYVVEIFDHTTGEEVQVPLGDDARELLLASLGAPPAPPAPQDPGH